MKIALVFNHFEDDYSIIVTGVDDEASLEPFVGEDDYIVTADWDGKSLVLFSRDDEDGYIEQLENVYDKESLEKYSKDIIKKEIQNQLKYLTEEDGLIEDVEFAGTLITVDLYDVPNCSPEEVWALIQNNDLDKLTDIAYEICADWLDSTYIDKDSSSVRGYLDINKDEIVLGGDHNFFIYTLDEYLKEHENEDYGDLEESLSPEEEGGDLEESVKSEYTHNKKGDFAINLYGKNEDPIDEEALGIDEEEFFCDRFKVAVGRAKKWIEKFPQIESVYIDEESDDWRGQEIVWEWHKENLEESFKSKDKYSVLREALDKLDAEDSKTKRAKTRARVKALRSKLKA